MIIRFVKMVFQPEKVDQFEELFRERKDEIMDSEGCISVELLRIKHAKDSTGVVYFTRSKWNNEDDLLAYRSSELFADTWQRTKVLFADKPDAWTLEIV